jgi:hypothetical protein
MHATLFVGDGKLEDKARIHELEHRADSLKSTNEAILVQLLRSIYSPSPTDQPMDHSAI